MDLKKQLQLEEKVKKLQSELNKTKKLVVEQETTREEFLEAIKEQLTPLKSFNQSLPKVSAPTKRELCIMLNDTHYGLNVYPEEVGNVNKFGWTEACRRTASVIEQACNFKPHNKNKITTVRLILNGDLLCGINHSLNSKHITLLVHQINGALHILSYSIKALCKAYPKARIVVHGSSGNHSDSPHKREGGNRVITEKFDNAENYVFYALSWIFSENKQVEFDFPHTPYVLIDLPAGRAMATHGDVMFASQLGNTGKNINVKALSEEIHKFSLGEVKKNKKPIDLVLLGHVHVFANFLTFHNTEIYVAPSLSGTDGYAHSLNINSSNVGQVIFESTDKFIIGDRRLIRVSDADKRSELDKIIPIFKESLKKQ